MFYKEHYHELIKINICYSLFVGASSTIISKTMLERNQNNFKIALNWLLVEQALVLLKYHVGLFLYQTFFLSETFSLKVVELVLLEDCHRTPSCLVRLSTRKSKHQENINMKWVMSKA